MDHTSFVGRVEARKGHTLLGGRPIHRSARFQTRLAAVSWLETVVEANLQAGRPVAAFSVVETTRKAQVGL